MGVGPSNNSSTRTRTETFTNPIPDGKTVEEAVTNVTILQVTPEVLERVLTKNLPMPIIATAVVAGKIDQLQEIVERKVEVEPTHYNNEAVPVTNINHGDEEILAPLTSVENVVKDLLDSTSCTSDENPAERLQLDDLKLAVAVDEAKQSFQEFNDALPYHGKVVLGVGPDGKPTFETVGAWEVRQEKEAELRQNDAIWMDRLESLKAEYISSGLEDVDYFLRRTEKINAAFPPLKKNDCTSLCAKVAKCYAENQNKVLTCGSVVEEFGRCVHQSSAV